MHTDMAAFAKQFDITSLAAGSVLTFSKTAAGIVTVCRMSEFVDYYTHYC